MVALVLAGLGAYVRALDEALSAKHSVWLVPILIAAIPLLRSGDVAGLVVGAVRYFLVIGVLYRFLFSAIAATREGWTARQALTGAGAITPESRLS